MIKRRDNHGLKLWRLPILLLVVLTLMVLAPSPVQAQVALEKYYGGSGDGFTLLTSDKMTLDGAIIVNSARYYGGSGDGFTLLTSSEIPLSVPNRAPTVDAVALYESNRTITATSMTPQVEYAIKVSVTDLDQLFELSTVTVTLYYDANGIYDELEVPGTGNTQTAAILTLTVGGTPVWAIDPSASTTWTIEVGSSTQPTLTNTSGDFWFHFKPSRVATETADPAKWHIHAVADDGEATAAGYQDNRGMNWYGEFVTNTTDVTWTVVTAGTGFTDDVNEVTAIAITYIANGDYSASVKAADWDGAVGGAGAAIYDEIGDTLVAQEFSLMADTNATLPDAVQVLLAGAVVDETGTITLEAGDTTTTNTLWLKLADIFAEDVYSGSITYIIANR